MLTINDLSNSEKLAALTFKGFANGIFTFENDTYIVQLGCFDDLHQVDISANPTINNLYSYEEFGYARLKIIKK